MQTMQEPLLIGWYYITAWCMPLVPRAAPDSAVALQVQQLEVAASNCCDSNMLKQPRRWKYMGTLVLKQLLGWGFPRGTEASPGELKLQSRAFHLMASALLVYTACT